jgi:hypothetical protein
MLDFQLPCLITAGVLLMSGEITHVKITQISGANLSCSPTNWDIFGGSKAYIMFGQTQVQSSKMSIQKSGAPSSQFASQQPCTASIHQAQLQVH